MPGLTVTIICGTSAALALLLCIDVQVEPDIVPTVRVSDALSGSPVAGDAMLPSVTAMPVTAVTLNCNAVLVAFGASVACRNCVEMVNGVDGVVVVSPQPAALLPTMVAAAIHAASRGH